MQVMKILLYSWAFFLPFVLELNSGMALEGVCCIIAIGFFGLDEVPALPCLALPCLALPCLALPCLALPCLALPACSQPACLPACSQPGWLAGWLLPIVVWYR
jgi:hypothetical protein